MLNASNAVVKAAGEIQIRNVWYLLLYAWDMGMWKGRFEHAVEGSPSLLGLLSKILAGASHELLRSQLGRAYVEHNETISGIRGRIDFAGSLKRRTFEGARAHCQFSELSIDTLKNQIIRSTMHRLASDPRLKHGEPEREAALRHELRALVRAFEGVALIPASRSDFGRIQLSRNDRAYALPLSICSLIHRLEMPTEEAGDSALVSLLKNEMVFHQLFESFVRNFYRISRTDYRVLRENLDWHDELNSDLVPIMRTDVTLIERRPPGRRIIIDTKYSVTTLSERLKFKSENLYQIYAYLRTQEDLSEAHRQASGVLLYPTTAYDVDAEMLVQGHRIRVVSVNLSDTWQRIEEHLLNLLPYSAVGNVGLANRESLGSS